MSSTEFIILDESSYFFQKGKNQMVYRYTQKQKDTLAKHSKHHTQKHMTAMKKDIKSGKTFKQAHKNALKRVGK